MAVQRHFLNWNAPVTQRAREFLLPADAPPHPVYRAVSLQDTLVIVPTRQAARRLSEALVRHGAALEVGLLAARIVPPSFLLQPEKPEPGVANASAVAAVWADLLRRLPPEACSTLFPVRTRSVDFEWSLRTGQRLQSLREDLADGGFLLADVPARLEADLEERERWQDLAELEHRYLDRLATLNLRDPLAARIAYAAAPSLPAGIRRIVVASVPEPSLLVLAALQQLSTQVDVDILVHAPPELADAFDDWGRPRPEFWLRHDVDLPDPDRHLLMEESPQAQSERVVERVSQTPQGPSSVAVGVPDASLTPFLSAALAEAGLAAFDPSDRQLADHILYRLLASVADLVAERSYESFSRFVRHPDFLAWLTETGTGSPHALLTELDTLQNEYLPARFQDLADALDRLPANRVPRFATLRRSLDFVQRHLDALDAEPIEPALRAFLQDLYRARDLHRHDPADVAFEAAADQVDRALREMDEAVRATPNADPREALRILILRLAEETYHPVPEDAPIDLEGWLELPWNDAPVLLVTGMNEGCVPDTRLGDAFLPDSLRAQLGLRHDTARLARDLYLMESLIRARAATGGSATFIAGRTSATGDPLKPSRLFFRCPDAELRRRAMRLFAPAPLTRPNVPASISFRLATGPSPHLPEASNSVTRLSVTAFRSYLACPFRFYLRCVLGMQPLDDEKAGPDARDFGILAHHVLQGMAESGAWKTSDEAALRAFMHAETDAWVRARFGANPPFSVTIAAEAAKERLGAAAREQVRLTAEGWEIIETEAKLSATKNGIEIVGRVDRIDRHRDTGTLRLMDYKTSDSATDPADAHLAGARPDTPAFMLAPSDRRPKRWVDLQLPLYVLLAGRKHTASTWPPEVGYFNLPKATSETRFSRWDDFDIARLDSASACADDVLRRIAARTFWPPAETIDFDDFASLMPGPPEACCVPPAEGTP